MLHVKRMSQPFFKNVYHICSNRHPEVTRFSLTDPRIIRFSLKQALNRQLQNQLNFEGCHCPESAEFKKLPLSRAKFHCHKTV